MKNKDRVTFGETQNRNIGQNFKDALKTQQKIHKCFAELSRPSSKVVLKDKA